MIIPNRLTEKWKLLKCAGDIDKIASSLYPEKTITSAERAKVSRAIAGIASEDVFIVVSDFYKKREALIQQA